MLRKASEKLALWCRTEAQQSKMITMLCLLGQEVGLKTVGFCFQIKPSFVFYMAL